MNERAARFAAQRLDGRPRDGGVSGLVRHLLAVQAQDPGAFPLALRARAAEITAGDLARARADRTVVRCWGPRGTLHLIAAEDLTWMYPLVRPVPAGSVRRLRQLGVDAGPEQVVAAVDAALSGRGPLTKERLGRRLAEQGLPVTGQGIVHAAMLAAGRGLVVLGPEHDGKPSYVHAADWLGAPLPTQTPGREAAVGVLVARYRAAHDPCEPGDLAAWSGLPLGEVRGAWTAAWTAAGTAAGGASEPAELPVRLIPAFDEYLLGWRDRDHAVPAAFRRRAHPGGGIIRSGVLVDGLLAGTWRIRRGPDRVDILIEPYVPWPPGDVLPGLAAEVAAVGTFLGLPARLTVAS